MANINIEDLEDFANDGKTFEELPSIKDADLDNLELEFGTNPVPLPSEVENPVNS